MSELSRAYWRNHHEMWDLIANWAELGPLPRRHLAVTQFPIYKPPKETEKLSLTPNKFIIYLYLCR
jgi:hypothetical protein